MEQNWEPPRLNNFLCPLIVQVRQKETTVEVTKLYFGRLLKIEVQ